MGKYDSEVIIHHPHKHAATSADIKHHFFGGLQTKEPREMRQIINKSILLVPIFNYFSVDFFFFGTGGTISFVK